jgi:RNA polymerase sigma-70 factor (ECF subfamily)
LEKFREESQLYTWLYRIATNETLSFLEQKKRKASISLEENQSLTKNIQTEANFNPQKLEWQLQLAIQELPEKQRLVFNLRYYDEMPYEKMSQILETSVGSLKASYHHAVKKIESFIINQH